MQRWNKNKRYWFRLLSCIIFVVLCHSRAGASDAEPTIRIASKTFAESYILAELAAQLLEHGGFSVERVHGLGGTLIVHQALRNAEIDIYPEYTGTILQAILKQPDMPAERLEQALSRQGFQFFARFGFNNSYAIAISSKIADAEQVVNISDLQQLPELAMGFSLEFLNREDGWPALKRHYQLSQQVRGIEHALAYRAIESGQLAATDAYTTDGEIDPKRLRLLKDDKQFFPFYYAGLLARTDLPEAAVELLNQLSGRIDDVAMQALNRRVSLMGEKPERVAQDFLYSSGLISSAKTPITGDSAVGGNIVDNTLVHLKLTVIALVLACLVAIPMALLLSQRPRVARGVLYLTGLVQTIPSLALLALMIPLIGLGELPAIIALFLYSLLPILRNSLTGLFSVDPLLKQVATGMGLTVWQQLWRVELPLAVPHLIAGVKTAAIISIGTATLAAFVGAGGLGEPIITGLSLNDHSLILQGAVPAALLAIITEFIFELLEKAVVPVHLLNQSQRA